MKEMLKLLNEYYAEDAEKTDYENVDNKRGKKSQEQILYDGDLDLLTQWVGAPSRVRLRLLY